MLNTPNEWHNEEETEEYQEEEFSEEYEDESFEENENYSEEDDETADIEEENESQDDNKKKMIIIASITVLIILLLIGGVLCLNAKKSKDSVKTTESVENIDNGTANIQGSQIDANGEEISIETEDDISVEIEDTNSVIPTEKPLTAINADDGLIQDNTGLAIPEGNIKTDEGGLQVDVQDDIRSALSDKKKGSVTVAIGDVGRQNPFMPKDKVGLPTVNGSIKGSEDGLNFEIIEPPQLAEENPDISKLLETKVSGILYDPKKPSAIINIEGIDQLVKIGDELSGFEIIAITQNKVVISSDNNVYRASVGQPLNAELVKDYVEISNLETKFKGSKKLN